MPGRGKTKTAFALDANINPECNVGVNILCTLQDYYQRVQNAAESEMQRITLEDIVQGFYQHAKNQPLNWD